MAQVWLQPHRTEGFKFSTDPQLEAKVDTVVYFRVVDPIKATVNLQNYLFAISQQAQTSRRSIIGQSEMDQLLAERDSVNRELRRIIDRPTEGPWGIRAERVEIKDVSLPEGMKRRSRRSPYHRPRRSTHLRWRRSPYRRWRHRTSRFPRSPQSRSKPNDRRRRLGWADSAAR